MIVILSIIHIIFQKNNQIYYQQMSRYQNYCSQEYTDEQNTKGLNKTALFFMNDKPRSFNGDTWDAKHLTSFLSRSNYSNWRGDKKNISNGFESNHKRSYSTRGDHFFRTTKDNKNQSKIGFTPIFPLVSNTPAKFKQITLSKFFNTNSFPDKEDRVVSERPIKLRCSPDDKFKFEGNALKFMETDPLTLRNEQFPFEQVNGYKKQRMSRLIEKRHPHGMSGIDHPQNPETVYYDQYEQKIKVRQQPNSHNTFLINRDWNSKKRSVPPVDEWKSRKGITIRKFRNENVHGYNILTNRMLQC